MPERSAVMKEIKHNGPRRKFVYDYTSAPITATFYTDKFLREINLFIKVDLPEFGRPVTK